MQDINLLAVIAAGVSAFLLGGLWYAPFLFGKAWMTETGITEEKAAAANPARVFGVSLILSLAAAYVFAMFLGPAPAPGFAVGAGFSAGLFWVAASFGINYLFEQKTFKLWLINGGFHTVQFTLYGLVLGLWH